MKEQAEGSETATSLRTVGTHWVVYGAGSMLSRLGGLVMLPIYTRFLTPQEYGIKAMVVVTVSVVTLVIAQGIRDTLVRFYWDDEHRARPEVISTGLFWAIGLASLAIGIALWCADPLAQLVFGAPHFILYLRLGLLTLFFSYIQEVPLAYLQVRQRAVAFTIVSLATFIMTVGLNVLFLIVFEFGLVGLFYSEVITNAFLCLLLTGMTIREVGWTFSLSLCRSMMRYGAPLVLVTVGWLVINTGDRFILSRYGSLAEVGIYSLAMQFAQVLLVVFFQPFLNVWEPAQFQVSRQANAAELFPRLFHFFLSVLLLAGFALAIFVEDVITVMAAPPFWPAAALVPLLVIVQVLMGVHSLFNTGILIKKRTEYAGLILLGAAGVNVLLNLLLIPPYLATGAVVSRIGALLVMVGITYEVSRRMNPIDFKIAHALKTCGYTLGLFLLSQHLPAEPPVVRFLLKGGLVLALCVLVLRSEVWRASDRARLWTLGRTFLSRLQASVG